MSHRARLPRVLPGVLLAGALLAGCAGLRGVEQPTRQLYQASSDLVAAEAALLDRTNDAARERTLALRRRAYVVAPQGADAPVDLAMPADLLGGDVRDARLAALQAIQVYAAKLVALTGDADGKALDADMTALAQSIGKGAKLSGGTMSGEHLAMVASAISALASIALDQVRYRKITEAAAAAAPHLDALRQALRAEAATAALVAKANADNARLADQSLLEHVARDARVDAARRLAAFDAVAARQARPRVDARPVLDALDAVLRANAAIASGRKADFAAFAEDALGRAGRALTVYEAVQG